MQDLLNVYTDTGLTVNVGKTKYVEVGSHRGMMANEHIQSVWKYIGGGGWRKFDNLYPSPYVVRVLKSIRLR